jgi:dolichol-phosphate mannosyltransferase
MLDRIKASALDIVIGSRAVEGGSMGEFSTERVALSSLGRKLSRAVCRADVSDPMSGFFLLSRKYFEEVMYSLSGTGFKILLDLLSSSERPVRVAEVGYRFGVRRAGESKLDIVVGLEYVELLLDKLLGGWLPVRYMIFGCVGALGVLINAVITYGLMRWAKTPFEWAQMTAGVVVIGLNFLLNNRFTFRAFRLRRWQMVGGMASFYAACSIGLFTNLTIAMALLRSGLHWYTAGLIGVIAGSVWNYWMSSLFVWKVAQRRLSERKLAHRAQPVRFENQLR